MVRTLLRFQGEPHIGGNGVNDEGTLGGGALKRPTILVKERVFLSFGCLCLSFFSGSRMESREFVSAILRGRCGRFTVCPPPPSHRLHCTPGRGISGLWRADRPGLQTGSDRR